MKGSFLLILAAYTITGCAQGFEKEFMRADAKHNLNFEILRAIGKHESGLNQLSIGFVLKDPKIIAAADSDLQSSGVKYHKKPYKAWYHYSLFFASVKDAVLAIPWLDKATAASTGYDIGLMQVNSRNAKRNGWSVERLLSDPEYNIDCGAELLADCRDSFGWDPAKTLECYNKGTRVALFDYQYYGAVFSRYKKHSSGLYQLQPSSVGAKPKKVADDQVMPSEYLGERTLF